MSIPFASSVSSSYCPTLGVPFVNVTFAFSGAESLSIKPPLTVEYLVISATFLASRAVVTKFL